MPEKKLNGTLKLLTYLLGAEGGTPIMKIQRDTNMPYTTIYNALKLLRRVGFIREEIQKGPPVRRLVSLTEKGRKAAEHAKAILELAGEL